MSPRDERVRQQLAAWRRDLINLNRNNRLLYLKPTIGLSVEAPSPEVLFEQLARGLEAYIPPADDNLVPPRTAGFEQIRFAGADGAKLLAKLRSLDRNANQTFMDRGIWILYLAFGLLEWEEAKGTDGKRHTVRSPLLLVPVELARPSASKPYNIKRGEDEQRVNPALLAKLETDFELTLSLPEDEDDLSPKALFTLIERQVQSRGWKVIPDVVLSTFSFQKEPILRDILENEESVVAHSIVRGLALGNEAEETLEFDPVHEDDIDREVPAERAIAILDADACQRRAIASAVGGNSFVMDGPPGTGKSQTIANMIAELLGKQRRVLFVSDKIAALEVVYNRLKEVGLHEFVLEAHSHKTTRKQVARELGRSIQCRVVGKSSLDESARERLRRRRVQLSEYVEALNVSRAPLHQSLFGVIGRIVELQHLPRTSRPKLKFDEISHEFLATLIDAAEALARAWGPVSRRDAFLWKELAASDWSREDQSNALARVEDAESMLGELETVAANFADELALYPELQLAELGRLARLEVLVRARPDVERQWLTSDDLTEQLERLGAAQRDLALLREAEAGLVESLGARWGELAPSFVIALHSTATEMEQLGVPGKPLESHTSESLHRIATDARELAQLLSKAAVEAEVVASAFRVSTDDLDLMAASAMGSALSLGSRRNLPEPQWFEPAGQVKAKQAIDELAPIVASLNLKADALREVFTNEVLELDLETLCVRWEGAYRGWFAWFNAEFRRDRKLLLATARSGRLRRQEVLRLRDALEWQDAARALAASAKTHASSLGHYWNEERTSFEDAGAALDVAREAQRLCGDRVPLSALQDLLSRGNGLEGRILAAATSLVVAEGTVRRFGELGERLLRTPIPAAASAAKALEEAATRLRGNLSLVDGVAGRAMSLKDATACAQARALEHGIRVRFNQSEELDRRLFGSKWDLQVTPPVEVAAALNWCADVRGLVGGPLQSEAADLLLDARQGEARLAPAIRGFERAAMDVLQLFNATGASHVGPLLLGKVPIARDTLRALRHTISDVLEWRAHDRASNLLAGMGLGSALNFCRAQSVLAEDVRPILERTVLEAWTDHILASDSRLSDVRASDRDALVSEFARLDRDLIRKAAFETIATCNAQRPKTVFGQAGIVLREAEKQKRHMPVRRLLESATDVVQAVKPCFMMSPLSVSQLLPSQMAFDVVIFDEASQVKPADAISSIYRGAQLVVAGDQKQLPPTVFFDRLEGGDDDAYDEAEQESFESVLDLCKGSGIFTSIPLRWHYRSRHEHLITYSNYAFYEGRLLTFPGALQEADDLGVEVFKVDGMYRRGGQRDNPIEAQKVGERVLFHARSHPHLSLGVVAFSEAQASTIDAVLERLADAHPELQRVRRTDRLNGLFVKNLETVQGDERDIIIFSMGYGKDENGKFTMHFGPLTKSGGERRLNVAITRARRRIEFITSVGVADFSSELASEGGRHLRRYLDFASRGADRMSALAIPLEDDNPADFESPFEAEVARVMRGWGYDVVPQVGCAGYRVDLSVRDPMNSSRFVLGVECDGAMYHSSRVARDRDRLRQDVLEGLGWRMYRIWGPAWYQSRAEEERRLKNAVELAIGSIRGPGGTTNQSPPAAESEVHTEPGVVLVDVAKRPDWAFVYECARIQAIDGETTVDSEAGRKELQRIVRLVVSIEGPVSEARVLRAVREALGIGRVGARIQACIDDAVGTRNSKGRVLNAKQGFMWMEGTKLRVRVPDPDDANTLRSVDEVPPQELERALLLTAQDAVSIDEQVLLVCVARLFGWDRSGSQIQARLESSLARLLKLGRLRSDDGTVRLGGQQRDEGGV